MTRFCPELDSIRTHAVPAWYDDAKFGIFIHWGLYSVPAWATPTAALGDIPCDEYWFTHNAYAEWYLNSIRAGYGPAWEHHVQTYGVDFSYEKFTEQWHAEHWDPSAWARIFREAGAQYVIPTTKHHDGFCLWNSDYTPYNAARIGPRRDIVNELSAAVRNEGLRFGVYYSGILDWRYSSEPILDVYDVQHPTNITAAYADYAYSQVKELIDKYKPSVLWNDIAWPWARLGDLSYLFAHYYNTVPEGVVNDRWSDVWSDFTTKEYNSGDKHLDHKWEHNRGIGLSFGYNQVEDERHLIGLNDLVALLVDTVAWNGNLLLNVGPKADGTIPENQMKRLKYLGSWLTRNGEAIYGTRPWDCCEMRTASGEKVYFTSKGEAVYALVDKPHAGNSQFCLPGLAAMADSVTGVGGTSVVASRAGDDLQLNLTGIPVESPVVVLKLKG